jgi:hypothetical protein
VPRIRHPVGSPGEFCSRRAPQCSQVLAALTCGIAAFTLYRATLLPGVDFGDTGSLQTLVGEPLITPRDGYPVYFAIGGLILRLTGAEPAHALNLASAVQAAIACSLFVPAAAELSGSVAAAAAAAGLFAVSYTFWSQAIIAEVYALHAVFVLSSLLLLLRWSRKPSTFRLAAFFLCYAVGFGNHLSMILLAPGYAAFLLARAPGGWRSMFSARVIGLALGCAVLGALPYLWNFRTLWWLAQPPLTVWDGVSRFWFDVTKSDWRETMVWRIPHTMLSDRLSMYWFDLRQQFGVVGPLLGTAGLVELALTDRPRAALMLLLYGANVLFAFGYNVGDTHVFYLPSHLVIALGAAVGVAGMSRALDRASAALLSWPGSPRSTLPAVALLAIYAGGRAYHDLPALDRSRDRRPTEVLDRLTAGLDDRRAILIEDLNWQIANGLSYYAKVTRPGVAVGPLSDVLLYAPVLVADNLAAGRSVVVTGRARNTLEAAYGPLLPTMPDDRLPGASLLQAVKDLARGTRYVLCILKPSRDFQIDADDLAGTLTWITGGRQIRLPDGDYAVIAGLVGSAPEVAMGSRVPFSERLRLGQVPLEIRMESWLAFDTIRRMGFGQVIAARRHALIVERGVSFAAFDEQGRSLRTAYAASLFEPEPRYLVSVRPPR